MANRFFYVISFAEVDVVLCAAITAASVEITQRFSKGFSSNTLVGSIDGCVDLKALGVCVLAIFFIQLLACHFSNIQSVLVDVLHKTFIMQLFFQSLIALLCSNHIFFLHVSQDVGLALFSALGVNDGVIR